MVSASMSSKVDINRSFVPCLSLGHSEKGGVFCRLGVFWEVYLDVALAIDEFVGELMPETADFLTKEFGLNGLTEVGSI